MLIELEARGDMRAEQLRRDLPMREEEVEPGLAHHPPPARQRIGPVAGLAERAGLRAGFLKKGHSPSLSGRRVAETAWPGRIGRDALPLAELQGNRPTLVRALFEA